MKEPLETLVYYGEIYLKYIELTNSDIKEEDIKNETSLTVLLVACVCRKWALYKQHSKFYIFFSENRKSNPIILN